MCRRKHNDGSVSSPGWHRFAGHATLLALSFHPVISPAAEDARQVGQPSPAAQFDLLDFRIDGNTVLAAEVVESAVYPFLGPSKSADDVEQARAALEKAYHDAGYATVFVDIPEQDVVNGMVILKITQGQVERLRVTGSRYFSLGRIKERLPSLAEGRVPHMPTVQAELSALAAQSSDRQVTPVIRAGNTPGQLQVDLKVEDQLPLHGSLELNSHNTVNTSRTRMLASLRYDNLWQRFHSASLQYSVSPENADEVEVWSGTYAMPTGVSDSHLALYGIGIASSSDVSPAGGLNVVGSGEIFGLRVVKPLDAGDDRHRSLSFGVERKRFGQSLRLLGADAQTTPIAYLPFQLGYDAGGQDESSKTSAGIGLHFSLRGLGNDPQQFEAKRIGARANYVYGTFELSHSRDLPEDFRLLGRLSAQYADSPLISNEQFSAGGHGSVRGYHQTELLGDHGVNASVELYGPDVSMGNEWLPGHWRALLFADGATLWTKHPLPGTPAIGHLAGFGAGLRMQIWTHFSGEFDWSYPLIATSAVHAGEQRVDFRVSYEL